MQPLRWSLALAAAALVLYAPTASADIYWVGNGKVGHAGQDGSAPNPDYIGGAAASSGVASNGSFVFWGRQGAVGRAGVNGAGANANFAGDPNCNVLSVASNTSEVFWLSSCASPAVRYIRRVGTAGGTPQTIAGISPSLAACSIAIDDTYLYWVDFDRIGRAPLAGGTPDPAWRQLTLPLGVQACGLAVDSQYVYYGLSGTGVTGGTAIGRANKDGTDAPNNSFITGASFIGGSANPSGLAVDATHVYWDNQAPIVTSSSIGRATKAAGDVNQSFIGGIFFPLGVAVDTPGGGPGGGQAVRCGGRRATIVGTPRADRLRGTAGPDIIAAGGGNDIVRAGRGNDLVCGGRGKDRLLGGPGRDRLLGQGGADSLIGGGGRDRLLGGPGRDLQRQ